VQTGIKEQKANNGSAGTLLPTQIRFPRPIRSPPSPTTKVGGDVPVEPPNARAMAKRPFNPRPKSPMLTTDQPGRFSPPKSQSPHSISTQIPNPKSPIRSPPNPTTKVGGDVPVEPPSARAITKCPSNPRPKSPMLTTDQPGRFSPPA